MEIDFLVPEKGRGDDTPVSVPYLGITAQSIRFLTFIIDGAIKVDYAGFTICLPHPHRFALHKLLISERRVKKDKALKDRGQGIDILRVAFNGGEADKIKSIFNSLPPKWKGYVKTALGKSDEGIIILEQLLG